MCLLALHKWKSKMKKEAFEFAWKRNWDWVGIAFRRDGKIFTYKTKVLENAWKIYNETIWYNELVLHFRMWTSWGNELNMVHPFKMWGNSLLFHNWVLNGMPIIDGGSDTYSMAKQVELMNLSEDEIQNWLVVKRYIESYINWYNKFLVISPKHTRLYWEHLWYWNTKKDIWYSNQYSIPSLYSSDTLSDDIKTNNWLKNEFTRIKESNK